MLFKFLRPIILIFLLLFLSSCCIEINQKFDTHFPTPNGYDLLNTRTIGSNISTYSTISQRLQRFSNLSFQDVENMVIKDTNSIENFYHIADLLTDVRWDTEDVLLVDFGSAFQVVDAHLEYRVFINHKLKEIMIGSGIQTNGGCAGSGLVDFSFQKVLVVPEIPEGYGLNFNLKD